MSFQPGTVVVVESRGVSRFGTINCKADHTVNNLFEDYYWVDFTDETGRQDCSLFSLEDLRKWNRISSGCECGAYTTNPDLEPDRHATYCPVFVRIV